MSIYVFFFFFSSRRRHTRCSRDWSSDVCSSDLESVTTVEEILRVFLGDAKDFLDSRHALARLEPAVHAEGDHTRLDRVAADVAARRSLQNETARVLADREQLVDAGAPAVAGPTALVAAAPAVERPATPALDPQRPEVGGVWRVGHATGGADPPHEPLREHAFEHGGDQVRLHPHILQARDRTGRVVRVDRGEHQVARERRLDGDLRRLEVADLADEDHVRVLPNDVPEPRGEREADLRLHVDLVDALELVLDRVLDGDDLPVGRVDLVEDPVEYQLKG